MVCWLRRGSARGPPRKAVPVPAAWTEGLERLAAALGSDAWTVAKAQEILAQAAHDPPPREGAAPAAALWIAGHLTGLAREEDEVAQAAHVGRLVLRETVEWIAARLDIDVVL